MEKEIFELFMHKRFPNIKKDNSYYDTWKTRFESNPICYMDLESMKVFKTILQENYIDILIKNIYSKK